MGIITWVTILNRIVPSTKAYGLTCRGAKGIYAIRTVQKGLSERESTVKHRHQQTQRKL